MKKKRKKKTERKKRGIEREKKRVKLFSRIFQQVHAHLYGFDVAFEHRFFMNHFFLLLDTNDYILGIFDVLVFVVVWLR